MNTIVRKLNFKSLADNVSTSTLKEFFLEKIESNMKKDVPFLHF